MRSSMVEPGPAGVRHEAPRTRHHQGAAAFARIDQHVGVAREIALPLLLLALILLPIDIVVRRLLVVRRLHNRARSLGATRGRAL